jgi:hypothetical protein
LLSHFTTHLSLKLVKPQYLIRPENTPHSRANTSVDPYLIGLGGGQCLGCVSHFSLVKRFAHYRAIERLPRLPQAAACGYYFILVTSPNLLHAHALFRCEPERLHYALLQLLPS